MDDDYVMGIDLAHDYKPATLTTSCSGCKFHGTDYGGCRLAWERGLRSNCPYWKEKGDDENGHGTGRTN